MISKSYSGVDNLEILLAEAKNYNDFLTRQLIQNSRAAKTALDFGAGIGTFAVSLRASGLTVTCLEPDPLLAERLSKLGFDTKLRLEEVPDASMDFIYSLNVLEHLEDDAGALRSLHSKLRPNGTFFLYVPAFDVYFSSMDQKVGHFRRYGKGTLRELMETVGFVVDKAVYADSLGFPISLLYKAIGSRNGDLNPRSIRTYDRIIFPASLVLDRLFQRFLGKNLMIVAHR